MRNVCLSFRSEYSVDSGILTIADILDRAREFRYEIVGLVDRHTLAGADEFLSGAAQRGLGGIVGVELSLASLGEFELARQGEGDVPSLDALALPRTYPIVLHPLGATGRETIQRLVTLAQSRAGGGGTGRPVTGAHGHPHAVPSPGRPHLFLEDLVHDHDGLIAQSPGLAGEVSSRIQRGQADLAERLALRLAEVFGRSAFHLGLTLGGGAAAIRLAADIRALASRTGIPLIASDRVDHADPGRRALLATRRIIAGDEAANADPRSEEGLFRTPLERRRLYRDDPAALENEVALAERLLAAAEPTRAGSTLAPVVESTPEPVSTADADHRLALLCESRRPADPARAARLDAELEAIARAKLAPWFLAAHELVRYARARSLTVGPVGGSARSSLVVWTLGLTDVDPAAAGIPFARFLVDAESGPPEMILGAAGTGGRDLEHYLELRYPDAAMARPSRVVRITAREALLLAARRLDIPETDRAAALRHITNARTPDVALAVARDLRLARLYRAGGPTREWLELARGLQGLPIRIEADASCLVLKLPGFTAPLTIRFEPFDGNGAITNPDRRYAKRLADGIVAQMEKRNPDVAARYHRRAAGHEPAPALDPRIQPILAGTQGLLLDDEQLAALPCVLAGFDPLEAERFRRTLVEPEGNLLELRRWHDRFVEGAVERGMSPVAAESIFQSIAASAPTLADRALCAAAAMSVPAGLSTRPGGDAVEKRRPAERSRSAGARDPQLDLAFMRRRIDESDDRRRTGTWGDRR